MVAALAVAWTGCGSQPTADLVAQARTGDGSEKVHAIRSLGDRPKDADRSVPVLIELLANEDAFIRRDAAQALGRLGPKAGSAVTALRTATRDKNAHVRRAAADALQKVDPAASEVAAR
jgi:HEAT repeat protein